MKRSDEGAMGLYTLLRTFIFYLNPFMSYRDTKFQTNSDVF